MAAIRRHAARMMMPLLLLIGMLTMPLFARAVEEPEHQVVRRLGGEIEIRRYAPYVVAEVLIEGSAEDAGNQAFPILAGYIFGKNRGERSYAMTAPVTQSAAPVRLPMTAPVTQAAAPGGWQVQFVLPKEVTLASAPEPNDARVHLREIPAHEVAVIRYSGLWSASSYDQHLAQLQAALKAADLRWTGDAVWSRYDPPFMPWFLRRNEIWLKLP